MAIPYEWIGIDLSSLCQRRGQRLGRSPPKPEANVLVLWLDDRAFLVDPVARTNALAEALTPVDGGKARPWRVIGPVRSDALLAMYAESQTPPPEAVRASYKRLHFYAATPTVPDELMMFAADQTRTRTRDKDKDSRIARDVKPLPQDNFASSRAPCRKAWASTSRATGLDDTTVGNDADQSFLHALRQGSAQPALLRRSVPLNRAIRRGRSRAGVVRDAVAPGALGAGASPYGTSMCV